MIQVVHGDLIDLAFQGDFDIIGHGVNCVSTMKSGIAVPMSKYFGCDKFPMETDSKLAPWQKLGNFDMRSVSVSRIKYKQGLSTVYYDDEFKDAKTVLADEDRIRLYVANFYTQLYPGKNVKPFGIPLDYDAMRMSFRKLAIALRTSEYEYLRIGLPLIGGGLAKGDPSIIKKIMNDELGHLNTTLVILP